MVRVSDPLIASSTLKQIGSGDGSGSWAKDYRSKVYGILSNRELYFALFFFNIPKIWPFMESFKWNSNFELLLRMACWLKCVEKNVVKFHK